MTEVEYKRKLKRLEWLMDRADEFNTKVYDDEIEQLSDDIEAFEKKEYLIPPPTPKELLIYHLERTGLKKKEFADRIGISSTWLRQILQGANMSQNMNDKIMNFDYMSL